MQREALLWIEEIYEVVQSRWEFFGRTMNNNNNNNKKE